MRVIAGHGHSLVAALDRLFQKEAGRAVNKTRDLILLVGGLMYEGTEFLTYCHIMISTS